MWIGEGNTGPGPCQCPWESILFLNIGMYHRPLLLLEVTAEEEMHIATKLRGDTVEESE